MVVSPKTRVVLGLSSAVGTWMAWPTGRGDPFFAWLQVTVALPDPSMVIRDTTVTALVALVGKDARTWVEAARISGMSLEALIVVYGATRLVMVVAFSFTSRSSDRPWVTS